MLLAAAAVAVPISPGVAADHAAKDPATLGATEAVAADEQCEALATPDEAQKKLKDVKSVIQVALLVLPAAKDLWGAYLTPGTVGPRVDVTNAAIRNGFRTDATTKSTQAALLANVADAVRGNRPPLQAPTDPVTVTPTEAALGQAESSLDWKVLTSYPGALAGGLSGGDIGTATHYSDSRSLTGRFAVTPAATDKGVLTSVTVRATSMRLDVADSLDFCPGNTADVPYFVDASRLEKTAYPQGGKADDGQATFTKPVLFQLTTILDDPTPVDVSGAYPGNDKDADGIPESEPWSGAQFRLDNCPEVANSDQSDSDGNGAGDAC